MHTFGQRVRSPEVIWNERTAREERYLRQRAVEKARERLTVRKESLWTKFVRFAEEYLA